MPNLELPISVRRHSPVALYEHWHAALLKKRLAVCGLVVSSLRYEAGLTVQVSSREALRPQTLQTKNAGSHGFASGGFHEEQTSTPAQDR